MAVVTTDNPRNEDPREIEKDVFSGFLCHDAAKAIADRAEAIGWALAEAQPGDCVLVAARDTKTTRLSVMTAPPSTTAKWPAIGCTRGLRVRVES